MKHRRLAVHDHVAINVGGGPHTGEVIRRRPGTDLVDVEWDDGVVGIFHDGDLDQLERIDVPAQRQPAEGS